MIRSRDGVLQGLGSKVTPVAVVREAGGETGGWREAGDEVRPGGTAGCSEGGGMHTLRIGFAG